MAAVADVQLVTITVNEIEVKVPKGEMIVESVKRVGLEIPIFCYHSRLKPVGMCRMCLVEVAMKGPDGSIRKMPKPQAACTLPASEGLIITTDSPALHNDRRGVLEFLLINHPLDCPICDRGGECPLQNNTIFYGPSTSRYVEMKRHAPKAFPLSKYVTLDLERCIQCGRCVRFTEEISGDAELGFRFRGANMQPSTFAMRDFGSKFSGNVIEICPVGALTSSKYRFRARPWDLQTKPGICTLCSNGCNVHVDYRLDQVVRINGRTNEAVNEEWTCDKGKFGHYAFNSADRLTQPLIRRGNELVPATWSEALDAIKAEFKGPNVAFIGGSTLTNEDLYALHRLSRNVIGTRNVDHRTVARPQPLVVSNTLESFEAEKAILVFGTSLADDLPIAFLRVRKAWFNRGTKVIVAHHAETDADSFAHLILRYKAGTESILAAALAGTVSAEEASATTGVAAADVAAARATIVENAAATITTRSLDDTPSAHATFASLASLGKFNHHALQANEQGADVIRTAFGVDGLTTSEILKGCVNGTIEALWVTSGDPIVEIADPEVRSAIEEVPFLVVQAHTRSEIVDYASVVLPMTAPTETEGTYTNFERRVQRFGQVLAPRGEAKSAWRIFAEFGLRVRPEAPIFGPHELFTRLSQDVAEFAAVTSEGLNGDGSLLG